MKSKRIIAWGLLLCMMLGMCSGCSMETESPVAVQDDDGSSTLDENGLLTTSDNLELEDKDAWYTNWERNDVVTMYLTVREGNSDDGTNHTWEEVNSYSAYDYEAWGVDRYKVEGLLQVGDENGPVMGEFGYGQYTPNSVVQIRGQTSTRREQKNYRISIKDGKGDWEGVTTINLNKHIADSYRFTNMLSYNLMQEIDEMISARTRFVHLYVKDETASGETEEFVDYGLYTYVEQVNKEYLTNHGLDKNGQLYKVEFFEFYQYEDAIMLKSDADYDAVAFEEYLEIKGSDDHSKLIQMLEELNDYSIPIEETFPKWFDEDNYFTYLAFHILMGNKDTQSRNQFLYSPSNINKFYFISWDNDMSLYDFYTQFTGYQEGLAYEEGISNYWGNVLHRRVLSNEEYRQKLYDKIHELLEEVLTEKNMTSKANTYADTVRPYLFSLPDIEHSSFTLEQYNYAVENIYSLVENNYQRYLDSLEKPMPFYLGNPEVKDGKLAFAWDASFDLDAENITYKFELSNGYSFTNVLYSEEGIIIPEMDMDMLKPGQYFYRVTATNESGFSQYAMDYYVSDNGKEYGMRCFWVTEDGRILLEEYEE